MPADVRRTRIKFCGITSPQEAALAVDAGADAIGVILKETSPRFVSLEQAHAVVRSLPAFIQCLAVVGDPDERTLAGIGAMGAVPQFHGDEPPDVCERAAGPYVKAFHVDAQTEPDPSAIEAFAKRYLRATLLFDSQAGGRRGGTGRVFLWDPLRETAARRRIIVSGGLTPQNVGDCIRAVRPYAVDVRSGIETGDRKDPEKMRAFVRAVKEADAQA